MAAAPDGLEMRNASKYKASYCTGEFMCTAGLKLCQGVLKEKTAGEPSGLMREVGILGTERQ